MSIDSIGAATAAPGGDPLLRVVRWVAAKVWLGCTLSGLYVLGHHFGWPQAAKSSIAFVGALALASATLWLPTWTRSRHYRVGIPAIDTLARVAVWSALTLCSLALLLAYPPAGTPATALLINTAWRTGGHRLQPLLRHLRYQTTPPPAPRRVPGQRRPTSADSTTGVPR